MGFIKEPKGIDFVIESKSLTPKDKIDISKFINQYKAKYSSKTHKVEYLKNKKG